MLTFYFLVQFKFLQRIHFGVLSCDVLNKWRDLGSEFFFSSVLAKHFKWFGFGFNVPLDSWFFFFFLGNALGQKRKEKRNPKCQRNSITATPPLGRKSKIQITQKSSNKPSPNWLQLSRESFLPRLSLHPWVLVEAGNGPALGTSLLLIAVYPPKHDCL